MFIGQFLIFFSSFICIFIGLLAVRFLKMQLYSFQGVFLLLLSLNVLINFMFNIGTKIWVILLIGLIGIIFELFLASLLGNKVSTSFYESVVVGIGLFPWYLNTIATIIYLVSTILLIVIISRIKSKKSLKKVFVDRKDEKRNRLQKNDDTYIHIEIPIIIGCCLSLASLFIV